MTRKIGSMVAGPDVVDGAGEKIAGKEIMIGMMMGMAISLTTSFLRVAERTSLFSIAAEDELKPKKPSLLGPEITPIPPKWIADGLVTQYLALRNKATYARRAKNPKLSAR